MPELEIRCRDLHRAECVPATGRSPRPRLEHESVHADAGEATASPAVAMRAQLDGERGGHGNDPRRPRRLQGDERAPVAPELPTDANLAGGEVDVYPAQSERLRDPQPRERADRGDRTELVAETLEQTVELGTSE